MKLKALAKFLLTPFLFIFFCASSILTLSNTSGFNLDRFACSICDVNHPAPSNQTTYVNIKASKEDDQHKQFVNLFENFYYSNLVYSIRQYCDNNFIFNNDDDRQIPITMHVQASHSISTKESTEGGYYLDNGIFFTYYSDSVLAPKTCRDIRYGCSSFVYISDKFADVLVRKYHLESFADPYKELITNEEYCVLPLTIDNKTQIRLCINNILYSTKRTGPRCCDFNENFGTVFLYGDILKKMNLVFEFDFKPSPFCITSAMKQCGGMGYSSEKYKFSFYTFNQTTNQYSINYELGKKYSTISSGLDVPMFIIFVFILVIGTVGFYWVDEKWKFDEKSPFVTFIVLFALFFAASTIATFTYTYPLFAICPIYLLIVYLILRWKELTRRARQIVFTKIER